MAAKTLTIDGKELSAEEGATILQAADENGIKIPTLCHLDGIYDVGACRLCLVELTGSPKLLPACTTKVAEGMDVKTDTERLRKYRRMTLELLFAERNHVCAVCVANGHCELQTLAYSQGMDHVRYEYRSPRWGLDNTHPLFGMDHNRCILCTRCVRFMGDVAGDEALCVEERGDRARIGIAPDHALTHPWAANVIDLCPVGALVSKDFLNKARAWELDRTASVCPNCSQGCNVTLETRDGNVVRMKPRSNADVNQYYMCDEGRLNYQWINRDDRLEMPVVAGKLVSWEAALSAAGVALKGCAAHVVASASLSNEALWLLKQAAGSGRFRVAKGAEAPLPGVKDLALRADRAPNATGAEMLGFSRTDQPLAGAGKVVVIAGDDCDGLDTSALAGANAVIFIGTVAPTGLPANAILLPTANFAEEEGTFTNLRGRTQRFLQARPAPGLARASWMALAGLAAAAGMAGAYDSAEAVFAAMAKSEAAFSGMSYDSLGLKGQMAAGAGVNA